jgi:hypothetical protein
MHAPVLKCGLKSMLAPLYGLKKTMIKILIYTVIAILLGTATMVAPLVLVKPSGLTIAGKDSVTNVEPDSQGVDREGVFASPEEPSASLKDLETHDSLPVEPASSESFGNKDGVAPSLYSIGLMIVPGFLVGLGVFVYFKKGMA